MLVSWDLWPRAKTQDLRHEDGMTGHWSASLDSGLSQECPELCSQYEIDGLADDGRESIAQRRA
jgi:hypothetical protein